MPKFSYLSTEFVVPATRKPTNQTIYKNQGVSGAKKHARGLQGTAKETTAVDECSIVYAGM
jgi:hypothetical protein